MKTIIFVLFSFSLNVFADTVQEQTTPVPVPKGLEGGNIVLTTKAGGQHNFSSDEYMVVKRVRITRVVTKDPQVITQEPSLIQPESHKNEIMLGARRDYTHVDKSMSATEADIKVQKDAVLDAAYMRHEVFGTRLNLGVGVDTNGTPKGLIGIDF